MPIRRSKKWPAGKATTANFTDLAGPIRTALLFAYDLKRKNLSRSVPWTGFDVGEDTKVGSFSPHEALAKDALAFNLEDQGHDALDVLIQIAIQLGIEQGRRVERSKLGSDIVLLNIHAQQIAHSAGLLAKVCDA